ncbi:MAG: virulence RhuM family protein [Bacteroidales bacterium]|nr:virulence RhuM family protein [Bacteroidales bacterium]
MDTGEIILYQPDSSLKIEVQINHDTVWLTQPQIAHLYGVDRTVIVRHIRNIYKTAELQESATCAKIAQVQVEGGRNVTREIAYFNLDMIISVGYRVNSINATKFRQWANTVLKDYLLRGYSINQRLLNIERKVEEHDSKIDFFVRTSLPPVEGIFFDGQVFDAYRFVSDLVRSAKQRISLFDNYIDDTVLTLLDKREPAVEATIYTKSISPQLALDLKRHNSQYRPITITQFDRVHDRFLCIDDTIYHVGASFKDLGKKWFAFSRLEMPASELINKTT